MVVFSQLYSFIRVLHWYTINASLCVCIFHEVFFTHKFYQWRLRQTAKAMLTLWIYFDGIIDSDKCWWHYLPFSISFHFSSDDINGTFYLLWNEHTHVLHPRLVAMILALWLSWKNFSMSGRKCVPGVPIELKYMAQFNHWACSTNIYFMFQMPTQMNEWMQRSLVKISVSQNLEINYIHKLAPD